jgi:pimeloyl-ACP methyl ester carboxylesterase
MRSANPRAELVEIERAAHMTFEDNPRGFAAALDGWLSRL